MSWTKFVKLHHGPGRKQKEEKEKKAKEAKKAQEEPEEEEKEVDGNEEAPMEALCQCQCLYTSCAPISILIYMFILKIRYLKIQHGFFAAFFPMKEICSVAWIRNLLTKYIYIYHLINWGAIRRSYGKHLQKPMVIYSIDLVSKTNMVSDGKTPPKNLAHHHQKIIWSTPRQDDEPGEEDHWWNEWDGFTYDEWDIEWWCCCEWLDRSCPVGFSDGFYKPIMSWAFAHTPLFQWPVWALGTNFTLTNPRVLTVGRPMKEA